MGIFDLLTKRKADRNLSAREYVDEAIRLEAAGDGGKIDVGKLEAHLATVRMTPDEFDTEVQTEQRAIALRADVAQEGDATNHLQRVTAHAKDVHAEAARIIAEQEQSKADADKAVQDARKRVDEIRAAKQELRQLVDTPERRQKRTAVKQRSSENSKRYSRLTARIGQISRSIQAVDSRVWHTRTERTAWLDRQQAELDRISREHALLEDQCNADTAQLASLESELVEV